MVHTGQPVMGPVGPVVPEKAPVSVFVRADDQAIRWNAFVNYRICMNGAGGGARKDLQGPAILAEAQRPGTFFYRTDLHPLAGAVLLHQVQRKFFSAFSE